MYLIDGDRAERVEEMTFADLGITESDIEEIVRQNIDMICDEEESLLLVGQQVTDQSCARSDLIAVDHHGDLVLIELKRDRDDMRRRGPLEFQAIRYAAGCAAIRDTDALIQNVFAPYVERHREEFGQEDRSSSEVAERLLASFFETNDISSFNARQRIVLLASDFDEQTLSAVAWLNSNRVDMACWRIVPSKIGERLVLTPRKILPVADYQDFYIGIRDRSPAGAARTGDLLRRSLPKIDALLGWGVVRAGDTIVAKGRTEEATLNADGTVTTPDGPRSLQRWLRSVFGWSSVQTYAFAVQKSSGRTLADLREEHMERMTADEGI